MGTYLIGSKECPTAVWPMAPSRVPSHLYRLQIACLLGSALAWGPIARPREASPATPAPSKECRWEWKKLHRVCISPPLPPPQRKPKREPNYVAFVVCLIILVGFRFLMA